MCRFATDGFNMKYKVIICQKDIIKKIYLALLMILFSIFCTALPAKNNLSNKQTQLKTVSKKMDIVV